MGDTDTYGASAEDAGAGLAREVERRSAAPGPPASGAKPTNRAASNRAAVAQVLRNWRAIERQLAGMEHDAPEAARARDEIARLRDEYHRRVEQKEPHERPTNGSEGTSKSPIV